MRERERQIKKEIRREWCTTSNVAIETSASLCNDARAPIDEQCCRSVPPNVSRV